MTASIVHLLGSTRRHEAALLAACLALLLLALFGPTVAQPHDHHHFADGRMLWGIPCALDVLSNLPFAAAGAFGLWRLWRRPRHALSNMERAMAALFFTGLLFTAVGSAWYHLAPDDAGLAIDRQAMAVAFAGLLGLAAARVSERAAAALGLGVLLLATAAVQVWAATANVLPWAVLQFGGVLLLAGLALLPPGGALPVRWSVVIAVYAAAKLLELGDHAVFQATGQWLSGHTLKHLVAAGAALPVLLALGARASAGQNAATQAPAR